jgi:hypothetical protein
MSRFCLVLLAGLTTAGPAAAATWADALFTELTKDFGSVPHGPTLVHPFRLTNTTKAPLAIGTIRVSCGCVSAQATKTFLRPGEEAAIVARMDTTRFTGTRRVTIFVQFDRPSYQEVRLWVQANSRSDLTVTPETLSFGQVKRGSAPTASVIISFSGDADWRITGTRCESNYVQTRLTELRRQPAEVAYRLTARLREDIPAGRWYADVWLKTNSSSVPQVRVPLSVEVESALTVTPETVTFGKVKPGTEVERRVVVRGVKPFKIEKAEAGDEQLSVQDSATEPKAVHVVTVKLKATQAGDLSRTVRLVTDLEEEGEIEFQVRAQVGP